MLGLSDLALRYARFIATVLFSICVAIVVSTVLSFVAYHTGYDVVVVSNASGALTTLYVFWLAWNLPPLKKNRLHH